MSHQIQLSDEIWALLIRCTTPFVDKVPEDTIRRALEAYETTRDRNHANAQPQDGRRTGDDPRRRAPRSRGVLVELDGHRIDAVSVGDLCLQVLRMLVDGHEQELKSVIPFRTSRKRYLVAQKPIHPGGNDFVVPVKYRGYYMEAHKDYKNAIAHITNLVERMGLSLRYLTR